MQIYFAVKGTTKARPMPEDVLFLNEDGSVKTGTADEMMEVISAYSKAKPDYDRNIPTWDTMVLELDKPFQQ